MVTYYCYYAPKLEAKVRDAIIGASIMSPRGVMLSDTYD